MDASPALDKLGFRHVLAQSPVEPVQPNAAFDIASLVLYGCQALPIRLKILLDRLFSVLQRDEVLQVLHGFGWTHEDYARGYILQEPHGGVLDRWNICSPEEEPLVLQQFLRFGETRAITQQLLLAQQELASAATGADPRTLQQLRIDSDIKKFIERNAKPSPPRRSPPPPPPPPAQHPLPPTRPPPAPPMSPLSKQSAHNYMKASSNGPCTTSSPPSSISSSPLSVSPLNRLQNMQPFDFRKIANPQEMQSRRRISEASDASPPGLMNLSLTSPTSICLPPPPPPPPPISSSVAGSFNPASIMVSSSLSGLISSVPAVGSKSPATDFLSGGGSSEFGSEEDDDDEENSHSALNLSRDGGLGAGLKSRPRPGHMRKATTPMKRQWGSGSEMPLNLGTQLINPTTGKKRVQCNVCLKTFCDKGALKIHFSAVHLREMHKCTVEGCNMMFSSRRSRNRHSANPNPKLHSPHLRRKISPHDGRSAQPHPLLIPPPPAGLSLSAALNPLSFSPFPLLTPPPELRHLPKQSLDLSMQRYEENRRLDISNNTSSEDVPMALNNHHMEDDDGYDDEEDGIVVDGGADDEEAEERHETDERERTKNVRENEDEDDGRVNIKRVKLSESDMDDDITSNMDSNDDSLSVVDTHSLKEENGGEGPPFSSKGVRKRKNQNPTRCAIPAMTTSNDLSDEDSSNDVVFPTPSCEGNLSNMQETLRDNVKLSPKVETQFKERDETKDNVLVKIEPKEVGSMDKPNIASQDEQEECQDLSMKDHDKREDNYYSEQIKKERNSPPMLSPENLKKENHKIEQDADEDADGGASTAASEESLCSSNALRQLESLSHGHFGDLPFMSGGPPSPARSQGSSSNDSPSDDGSNMFFQDSSGFIGNIDVPIDKDNPRRCTACGKIFQNHFGVKTHFQNVHLKLMHKCTVEGCNAAFPSKRSRDRHSANLNLHRKLLSTSSSDKSAAGALFMDKSPFASLATNPSLHSEFLARLYAETQSLPLNLEAFKNLPPLGAPPPPPPGSLAEQMLLNGDRLPPPHPSLLLPPLGFAGLNNFSPHLSALAGVNGDGRKDRGSRSNSPVSPPLSSRSPPRGYSLEEEKPSPDRDGLYSCKFCSKGLSDAGSLKEHYEQMHLGDLVRCSVPGCGKLFSSRDKRKQHTDSVHVNNNSPSVGDAACS